VLSKKRDAQHHYQCELISASYKSRDKPQIDAKGSMAPGKEISAL